MAHINDGIFASNSNQPTVRITRTNTLRRLTLFVGIVTKMSEFELKVTPYLALSFLIPAHFIHQEYLSLQELRATGPSYVSDEFPFAVIRIGFFSVIMLIGSLNNTMKTDVSHHSSLVDAIACLVSGGLSCIRDYLLQRRRSFSTTKCHSVLIYYVFGAISSILDELISSFPTDRQFSLDHILVYVAIVTIQFNTRCIINLVTFLFSIFSEIQDPEHIVHETPPPEGTVVSVVASLDSTAVAGNTRDQNCVNPALSQDGSLYVVINTNEDTDVNTAKEHSQFDPSDSENFSTEVNPSTPFRDAIVSSSSVTNDGEGASARLRRSSSYGSIGEDESYIIDIE